MRGYCVCLLFFCTTSLFAEYNEHLSFLLLSHSSISCDVFSNEELNIPEGVYIDKLEIANINLNPTALISHCFYNNMNNADYIKEMYSGKTFAWGCYDDQFKLTSLEFISMYSPDRSYSIKDNDIRGISKGKDKLFFFTSRNPPIVKAFDTEKNVYNNVKIEQYLSTAEKVGVRITEAGDVLFCGTGMETLPASFKIPKSFVSQYAIDNSNTWNLFINNDSYIVLLLSCKEKKNAVVFNAQNSIWKFLEIDGEYTDIQQFNNFLVFQYISEGAGKGRAVIYDMNTDELVRQQIMPFSKIIYLSTKYMLIAQPYRLLLANYEKRQIDVKKIIDYNLALYVKMVLKL